MEAPQTWTNNSAPQKLRCVLKNASMRSNISALQESVVKKQATPWPESGSDFQFATAVAIFGMKLRGISDVSTIPWDGVR